MRWFLLLLLLFLFPNAALGQFKKPKIVGQKDLSTTEGKPITIQLTDLYVEEKTVGDNQGGGDEEGKDDGDEHKDKDDDDRNKGKDKDKDKDKDRDKDKGKGKDKGKEGGGNDRTSSYPQGYTLEVFSGKNYSVSGPVVTPDANFTGELSVEVRVSNDRHASNKYGLKISVRPNLAPSNVPPVITGQSSLTTQKNKPLTIKFSDLIVTDPDDQYPDGFALILLPGDDYSVTQTTVSPEKDFTGMLTVPVVVNDGKDDSKTFNLKITVAAPDNIAPQVNGQVSLKTPMNQSIEILLSHLTVTDPDNHYPTGFKLKILAGDHYTARESVVTPAENFKGTLIVKVTVSDGDKDSPPFDLKIEVFENVQANTAPEITGQIPLSISKNQPVKIVLSHLLVNDPDNNYPADFTLKLFPGEHYTLDGAWVKADDDFTGDLFVKVSVHDGKAESSVYDLKITVIDGPNNKPVITGQAGIKIPEGKSLTIIFSHLAVEDQDNVYPGDFTLAVLAGNNYELSNNTITPAPGFLGTLSVKVTVNDGQVSSDPFDLQVQVIAKDRVEITGQKSLEFQEDSSFVLRLSDLTVNDPTNSYPTGFSLQILAGENYGVNQDAVKPMRDFYGNLTVFVTISKDGMVSEPFSLLVIITPVNDPPALDNFEADPLTATGTGPWTLANNVLISDVDDDHLLFAEIGIDPEQYLPGFDRLEFETTENVRSIFDGETGVLFLLGRATLGEYQNLIRSVKYGHEHYADTTLQSSSKKIYFRLNDGKDSSPLYERILMLESNQVELEIPSAFTPNNDQANDTWKITLLKQVEQFNTFIRVYDKRGNLVFETSGLEEQWDGHMNGSPLPADIYFYTIEMDLAYRKVSYKGIVSILR